MYNTHNISHFQATLSSTKSHYVAPCLSSILLDKTSLVLISYALVHHPNYLMNHSKLITKATKAYWMTMKLTKYAYCSLHHAISNGTTSYVLTFSPTLIVDVLFNIDPSAPLMKSLGLRNLTAKTTNYGICRWKIIYIRRIYSYH
jgi:hypothetical protein